MNIDAIKLKAFVHNIDSNATGFLYARLWTDFAVNFIRISSAMGEDNHTHVVTFATEDEMLTEAKTQCRANEALVMADESILANTEQWSLNMLLDNLKQQHNYLFNSRLEAVC